ncbi:hypothetical protein D3C78_1176160 [compost metagenome]
MNIIYWLIVFELVTVLFAKINPEWAPVKVELGAIMEGHHLIIVQDDNTVKFEGVLQFVGNLTVIDRIPVEQVIRLAVKYNVQWFQLLLRFL